jgi:DNA-binding Xre family transcriptional regulator
MRDIYHKIDRILKQRSITTRALIDAVGLSNAGYYKMVKTGDMKLSMLDKVCKFLEIDINKLIESDISDKGKY